MIKFYTWYDSLNEPLRFLLFMALFVPVVLSFDLHPFIAGSIFLYFAITRILWLGGWLRF